MDAPDQDAAVGGTANADAASGRPPLAARNSKSKLYKQKEVESEDPPHKQKVDIPETRVESFENMSDSGVASSVGCNNAGGGDDDGATRLSRQGSKLVRGDALCGDDDTKLKTRQIEKQISSKSGSAGSSLSRDSSCEYYTDSTGIDLELFIINTLHKNAKDRQMVLWLEDELRKLVEDADRNSKKFPPMSSYNRMLVHRVSAFFGLDHNVDQSGTAVVVNKTDATRMPEGDFKSYIRGDIYTDEAKRTLRKDCLSYEEPGMAFLQVRRHDGLLIEQRKTRSFEDRDDRLPATMGNTTASAVAINCQRQSTPTTVCAYRQQRRQRIVPNSRDSSSSMEVMESPISVGGYSSCDSVPQMGAQAVPCSSDATGGGLLGPSRPWSSTDSHSSSLDVPISAARIGPGAVVAPSAAMLLTMQKAGSFGGVPNIYHQHAVETTPVRLTRRSNTTDTSGSRGDYSPGAMGRQPSIPEGAAIGTAPTYHSHHLHHHHMTAGQPTGSAPTQQVVFAVASLDQLPPGATIINPGQPYFTPTGSIMYAASAPTAMNYVPTPLPQAATAATYGGSSIDNLSQQMQQVNLHHAVPPAVDPLPAAQSPSYGNAPPPCNNHSQRPQVYTYYVGSPAHGATADGSGGSAQPPMLVPYAPQQPYVISSGYQSSYVHYLHSPHVVYTQATVADAQQTQVTFTQSPTVTDACSSVYGVGMYDTGGESSPSHHQFYQYHQQQQAGMLPTPPTDDVVALTAPNNGQNQPNESLP